MDDYTEKAPALLFDQISYSVNNRKLFGNPPCINRRKLIIEKCGGIVNQGELVAIMGTSGAGKTTLLDVLAKRKTYGHIEGTVLYNGKQIDKTHLETNIAGYVRQDDYHLAQLTVQQTLHYAADLRCRASRKEKDQKIDYLMKALSLKQVANNKVGDRITRGISGGEARRLSIGIEMLNDPDLLFLDEPTSGLDSASSRNTIHQPSREIFEFFDKVILLAKSESGIGRMAYYGPVLGILPYFSRLGYPPSSQRTNPADHMIQLCSYKRDTSIIMEDEEEERLVKRSRALTELKLGIRESLDDEESKQGMHTEGKMENTTNKVQEVLDAFENAVELKQLLKEVERCKSLAPSSRETTWKSLWLHSQIIVLTKRQYQSIWNDKAHLIGAVVVLFILGVILSSGYWRLSYEPLDIQNRISLLFFLLLSAYMVSKPFFAKFPKERVLVNHERGAKLYGTTAYFISSVLSSIPIQLYLAQIYATIIYWCANLRNDFIHYAIFISEYSLVVVVLIFYALFIGSISSTVTLALEITAVAFTIMLLFNGFFMLQSSIPPWWIWANWASPLKYPFYVALVNEFEGVTFDCDTGETCNFKNGKELLDFYNCDNTSLKWPYIAVTFGFILVFAVLTFLALKFLKFEKR